MRPQKITLSDMGVRDVLVYRADYHCSHSGDERGSLAQMPLSDIEPRFVCAACGKRGGEVRPDFN